MDTARYVVGCVILIMLPPALVWWFLIHPFVGFWRRVGVKQTFTVATAAMVVTAVPLYVHRDRLLMSDLGTNWGFIGLAVGLGAVSTWIALKRRKHLTTRILAGAPELEASGKGGTLLTEGPYAVVRNPRYVEVILGTFAYAAFANYVGAWLMALATVPMIHLIVILEEKELRDRFGEAYEAYVRNVPRYIPSIMGRGGDAGPSQDAAQDPDTDSRS